MRRTFRYVAAILIAAVLLAGCNRSPENASAPVTGSSSFAAPRNPGASGSAKVTYKPGVQVIEQADAMGTLIGISHDGSTLVFDRRKGKVPEFADGQVIVIKGLLARKVLGSEIDDSEVAILTVPVGLQDIVSDAKIHIETPIRFGAAAAVTRSAAIIARPSAPSLDRLMEALMPSANAQSPTEERRKAAEEDGVKDAYGNVAKGVAGVVMSGWETTYSAEPTPGQVNLHLQFKKSLANVGAVITGEGFIKDFDFSSDIDVQHSIVERAQMNYKKINGRMNFKWEIQTSQDGALLGNARMKLPTAIEIPLYQYLGGLPLYLEISGAVLIKPAFNAQYEFARGSFHINYNGAQSFTVHRGTVDADGEVEGDIELDESEAGSGAPVGLVLAVAMPRIELSIGASKLFTFEDFKDAAAKADKYLEKIGKRVFGAEAMAKLKDNPMAQITASKIVDTALGSDAAAYIELQTGTGMSHTGSQVMVPCVRTDIHLIGQVGFSAHAFGAEVGNQDKQIYKKDFTRVKPSEDALCKNL